MKFKIIFLIFISLFFFGCDQNKKVEEIDVFSKNLIVYADGETPDKITKDFSLVTDVEGIKIDWISSTPDIINIENDKAKVTRSNKDEFITITASYKINDEIKKKWFIIVVLKDTSETTNEDKIAPVISGISDMEIELGTQIDLLINVQAIDDIDGDVDVKIKENNLDVNKLGSYTVVFEAEDSAGNIGFLQINIKVIKIETKTTYTEDFSKLPISSSTYTKGSFIGNHEIVWEYSGSRGDQPIDGKALTFGGKTDDYSSLKASFTGGISHFSVDLKKAFTQNNLRKVALIINDDIVEEFTMDVENLNVQIFKVDLEVFGDYTLEIAQVDTSTSRAQISIDNIVIVSNPKSNLSIEEQNLNKDFEALEIQKAFIEAGNISLPNVGLFGSTITWKYTDSLNLNNSLINIETGVVHMPTSGIKEVAIKALLKSGNYEITKTFIVKVGEGDPILISEVYKGVNDQKVKILGTVSNVFETVDGKRFFIQDSSKGILVHLESDQSVNIGDTIEMIAKKKTLNGVIYLSDVSRINKVGTKVLTPIDLRNQNLESLSGILVNLNGLLKHTYGAVNNYTLVNEFNEIDVYVDEKLINSAALKSLVNNKVSGTEVDLFGIVYIHNGDYKVYVTNPSDVEVDSALSFSRIDNVIHSHLDFPSNATRISKNMLLFSENDLFTDLNITWSSSNTQVLNNIGIIYPGSEDTTVTLTYKIYIGEALISSHDISLIIEKKSSYTGYYANIQGLSGTALKSELNSIVSKMKTISYTATSFVLEDADIDLSKTGQLLLIYSRTNARNVWDGASTWNKEHIWPQSKLGLASKSDIHNLRAANPGVNSSRGNDAYAEGTGNYSKVSGGWYPGDQDKGDVARIVLYMNIRWDLPISKDVIGDLQMFLRWHIQDPVDDFEIHRNNVIYQNQENRNPFIDHPELVEMIYGSTNLNLLSETSKTSYLEFITNNHLELLNRRVFGF